MLHDQTATKVSLARTMLAGLDPSREMSTVRTASLILLLEQLIELGQPGHHARVAEGASRTVMGVMVALNGAADGAK